MKKLILYILVVVTQFFAISSILFCNERPRGKNILYWHYDHDEPTATERKEIRKLILAFIADYRQQTLRYKPFSSEAKEASKKLPSYGKLIIPVGIEILKDKKHLGLTGEGSGESLEALLRLMGNMAYFFDGANRPVKGYGEVKTWRLWWKANKYRDMLLPEREQTVKAMLEDWFYGDKKARKEAAKDLDYLTKNYPDKLFSLMGYLLTPSKTEQHPEFAKRLHQYLCKVTKQKISFISKNDKPGPSRQWWDWHKKNSKTFKWPSHVKMLEKELKGKRIERILSGEKIKNQQYQKLLSINIFNTEDLYGHIRILLNGISVIDENFKPFGKFPKISTKYFDISDDILEIEIYSGKSKLYYGKYKPEKVNRFGWSVGEKKHEDNSIPLMHNLPKYE